MKRLAALTAILVLLALSGSASAATTIGQNPSPYSSAGAGCANCGGFQTVVGSGASYVVPSNGVITSFSVLTGSSVPSAADQISFMVVRPASGATYTMVGHGPQENFAGRAANKLETFPVKLTVEAGDLIGSNWSTSVVGGTRASSGTNSIRTSTGIATAPEGSALATFDIGQPTLRLNLTATLEPDADHDGYGDETQDGCPTDRSDHGPCTAPTISAFKFSLSKFAVAKNGAVLAPAATAKGTTVIITLSKAARVQFEMRLKTTGRQIGTKCKKQTSRNRKKKKCTRYPATYTFARELPQGTSNLGFSGRIKVGSRTRTLATGNYVAYAKATTAAFPYGSGTSKAAFQVVAPARPH
ncbi:MAG: hypothetical protein JHC98_01320 [Thermoleophilaceae bacterium]|nr:hypothetical protein [Thermoleophilaceae bacterium]